MKHKIFTDEELRDLVVKVFDGKIFTSFHCQSRDITMIFMPLLFMYSPPSPPSEPSKKTDNNIKTERKNKLNLLDEKMEWEKEMEYYNTVTLPEWEKNEQPKIQEFVLNIGMIYESIDKALPRSCNGYPMFPSCSVMSKSDSTRFLDFYKKYEEKRKELDKIF